MQPNLTRIVIQLQLIDSKCSTFFFALTLVHRSILAILHQNEHFFGFMSTQNTQHFYN